LKRFKGWRPLRRWKKRRAVAALARNEKIDGVFCDSWKSVESLPKSLKAPVVVFAHGSEYPISPTIRKEARIEAALKRASWIFSNSKFTAEAVRPYLPKSDDPRLDVVYPTIKPLPDPVSDAQKAVREKIAGRAPVIGVVARLEPRKGIDSVISAMRPVLTRHPKAVFLIAGAGEDSARLKELAVKEGVAENVEFLGRIDNEFKYALLSNLDVFAMPVRRVGSSVEGFGVSYIEAGWYGVPCLAGRGGGAAEAVVDGKTGLVCDGGNLGDIAAKLLRLLDDDIFRSACGEAAKARARAEFPWSRAMTRFDKALKERQSA
ncbi:MAG: glycosyltransferase family 4 protein, partial [Alphaproteobacteria bacterium]|nr:glycosyltransferase family 4 protein [Alphaproteobacteria bacterium]